MMTPWKANLFTWTFAMNAIVYAGGSFARMGTVLSPGQNENNVLLESNVIHDTNPLLFDAQYVFKAWFSIGFTSDTFVGIYYAESLDGLAWRRWPDPVAPGYERSFVLKDGNTFKMWAVPVPGDSQIDYLTSTDGTAFTVVARAVLNRAGGSAWDADYVVNPCVLRENATTWKMLYEARRIGVVWQLGLATSSDGIVWTRSPSNPVISLPGSTGGPFLLKFDSNYFLLAHHSPFVGGFLPTEIYAWTSTDCVNWTPLFKGNPVLPRLSADENPSNNSLNSGSQTADATLVEANGKTYLFYTAAPDQTHFHVNLAIAPVRASVWFNRFVRQRLPRY